MTLLGTAVHSNGQPPSERLAYRVDLRVDRQSASIGEQITAVLTLTGPPGVVSARPRLGKLLGPLEVLRVHDGPPGASGMPWSQSWTMVLTTFTPGALTIGGVAVEGTLSRGTSFVTAESNSVRVDVNAPKVSADDELLPLSDPLAGPEQASLSTLSPYVLVAGILALGCGAGAARLWTRLTQRAKRNAFWRQLHVGLSDVAKSAPASAPSARAQYGRASSILRQALSEVLGLVTEPLTSTELGAAVAASADCRQIAPELAPLLAAIDKGRFSGRVSPAVEHARVCQGAAGVLRAVEVVARSRRDRSRS